MDDLETAGHVPILQQSKSFITTNPFIPESQRMLELEALDTEANAIIQEQYNRNVVSSVKSQSLGNIAKNMSGSIIGIMDDMFAKPSGVPLMQYMQAVFQRDQRYAYIGMFLLLLAVYLALTK